jgi:hypothetical protein
MNEGRATLSEGGSSCRASGLLELALQRTPAAAMVSVLFMAHRAAGPAELGREGAKSFPGISLFVRERPKGTLLILERPKGTLLIFAVS